MNNLGISITMLVSTTMFPWPNKLISVYLVYYSWRSFSLVVNIAKMTINHTISNMITLIMPDMLECCCAIQLSKQPTDKKDIMFFAIAMAECVIRYNLHLEGSFHIRTTLIHANPAHSRVNFLQNWHSSSPLLTRKVTQDTLDNIWQMAFF